MVHQCACYYVHNNIKISEFDPAADMSSYFLMHMEINANSVHIIHTWEVY